jgi:hypothetical protein
MVKTDYQNNNKNLTPFFIVGTGRCGTQMLRNLLSTNQSIKITPETHFIPVLYEKFGLNTLSFDDFYEVLDNTFDSKGNSFLKNCLLDAKHDDPNDFYIKFKSYIDKYNENYNIKNYLEMFFIYIYGQNSFIGDKTPHYGIWINDIKKIWPDAKIIHLVRDGVNTAESMTNHNGFRNTIESKIDVYNLCKFKYHNKDQKISLDSKVSIEDALIFWEKVILKTIEELDKLPEEDVLTIKYEDLILFPAREVVKIAEFLGFDKNETWINKAIQIPKPFPENKQIDKFSAEQYEYYYNKVKSTMEKLGYPYNFKIKRTPIEFIKEFYRGRSYYLDQIKYKSLLKRFKKASSKIAKEQK